MTGMGNLLQFCFCKRGESIVFPTAFLCTHKNQSGRYFALTMAYSIPSFIGALAHDDYAGGFLL